MAQPVQKKLILLFWIIALLDMAGIAANIETIHYAAKPLLMPVLLLILYVTKPFLPQKNLLFGGLFFSWLGDLFLLFDHKHALFFIFGLACFLTTHIFYIIYFLKIRSKQSAFLKNQPVFIALVLAYGITLVWQLYPYLGNLAVPVMVYAAVICVMLLCSLHIFLKVNKKAAVSYLTGAMAFVVSDSLLAINKFYQPFAFAGILIMLTYCAAQFFIVNGFIQQYRS